MIRRSYIAMLGAGLCLLGGPALAQDRTPVQAKVKLNDLNLNSRAGQKTAHDRIESAADRACDTNDSARLADSSDANRCKAEVRTSGAEHVALQQSEARSVQRHAAMRRPGAGNRWAHGRYRHCYWSKRYHKRTCVWRRR